MFKWRYLRAGSGKLNVEAGHITDKGYRRIRVKGKNYFAQRLAWFYMTGEWPPEGYQVDHKNNDKLNNSWLNLRLATPDQNSKNYGVQVNNKLQIKGVVQRGNKFEANIYYNGKLNYLGTFNTKEEAAKAYCDEAMKLDAEFAHSSIKAMNAPPIGY